MLDPSQGPTGLWRSVKDSHYARPGPILKPRVQTTRRVLPSGRHDRFRQDLCRPLAKLPEGYEESSSTAEQCSEWLEGWQSPPGEKSEHRCGMPWSNSVQYWHHGGQWATKGHPDCVADETPRQVLESLDGQLLGQCRCDLHTLQLSTISLLETGSTDAPLPPTPSCRLRQGDYRCYQRHLGQRDSAT